MTVNTVIEYADLDCKLLLRHKILQRNGGDFFENWWRGELNPRWPTGLQFTVWLLIIGP